MRSRSKNAAYFDDDFEVTYEDDMSFEYDTDETEFETQEMYSRGTIPLRKNRRLSDTMDMNTVAMHYDNDFDDDDYTDDIEEYNSDYDVPHRDYHRNKQPTANRRRRRPTQLAAPIQKGGNAMLGFARTIIRNLTLFLMLAILILMGYNFLRGSTPYGDIINAVETNTYTMSIAAYFLVVAALMFYEIVSMLWAMTRVRVRDEYGTYKEDVGRGMFSFILLYLSSFASFYIADWIPESMEILRGFKGAMEVFGSMHNVLFGICLAGVISCLFRKYSITL